MVPIRTNSVIFTKVTFLILLLTTRSRTFSVTIIILLLAGEKKSEPSHVGSVKHSLSDIQLHIRTFNAAVDAAKIPYSPTGPNSNTYSNALLLSVGIEASPDMLSPGFSGSLGTSLPSLAPLQQRRE